MSLRRVDDELVDGVRERSEAAYATVYRLVASDLLSFAYGMLADRASAEDAVQQAFLELARAGPGIRGDGRSLVSWLYRSVRFTCLDELRRRKRHPETPTDDLPEVATSAPDEPFDTELVDALAVLTERQRTIVVLRYVLDASVEDIAGILGTNRAAVYAASSRAERRLARALANVEQSHLATSSSMREPRRDGP